MNNWWQQQIKCIPKSEELCMRMYDGESKLIYVISIDRLCNYKLYSVDGCVATYTKHRAANPLKLEKYMQPVT